MEDMNLAAGVRPVSNDGGLGDIEALNSCVSSLERPNNDKVRPTKSERLDDFDPRMTWTLGFECASDSQGERLMHEYTAFQIASSNIYLIVLVFLLCLGFFVSRGCLENISRLGGLFQSLFVLWVIALAVTLMLIAKRLMTAFNRPMADLWLQKLERLTKATKARVFQNFLEDTPVVLTTLVMGLLLLARIIKGACPPGTSTWDAQGCDPEKAAHEMPVEILVAMITFPVIYQIIVKGTSKLAIAISIVISLVFMNICLYLVGSELYYWLNAVNLAVLLAAYENEKTNMMFFLQCRISVRSNEHYLAAESRRHFIEIERDAASKVSKELRVAMSNTAHDIKSPVAAIALAFEALESIFSSNSSDWLSVNSDLVDIIRDAAKTMMFFKMTIDRSVDFAKIISNVAFEPILKPVDAFAILHRIADAVQNDCGTHITIDFPANLPHEGQTDLAWLRDNILCVVSNAVKFSIDKSDIVVRVRPVPSPLGADTATSVSMFNKWKSTTKQPVGTAAGVVLQFVQFSVQDSGPGLSADQFDTLFDSPVQAWRGDVGGMGLGLHCLAHRVRALGGTYGARNRDDGKVGTLLWFTIPFYDRAISTAVAPRSGSNSTGTQSPSASMAGNTSTKPIKSTMSSFMKGVYEKTVSSSSTSPTILTPKITTPTISSPKANSGTSSPAEPSVSGTGTAPTTAAASRGGGGSLMSAQKTPSNGDNLKLPKPQTDNKSEVKQGANVFRGLSVLVVDDAVTILKMVSNILKRSGADVTQAMDGLVALNKVKERAAAAAAGDLPMYDIILTDIQMPVMDGNMAAREMRSFEREQIAAGVSAKKLCIIGMSARSEGSAADEAIKSGMDGFLPKPFKLEELVAEYVKCQLTNHRFSLDTVAEGTSAVEQ